MKSFNLLAVVFTAFGIVSALSSTSSLLTSTPTPTPGINATANAVIVNIGRDARNVGSLTGPTLYDQVYKILDYLCPSDQDTCRRVNGHYDTAGIEVNYVDGNVVSKTQFLITPVEGTAKHKTEGLRRLMIGTVASVLQRASEDQKNCVDICVAPPDCEKWVHHCNVANEVSVGSPDTFFHFKFESKGNKKFDCAAIVEAVNKDVGGQIPEWEKEYGGEHLDQDVECIGSASNSTSNSTALW